MDFYRRALALASTTQTKRFSLLLLTADFILCGLIIWKVPYTEIDWVAYMQQVKQYLDGEYDYAVIKGNTGPLVYPAAHLYIYSLLYRVTDGGNDILVAQIIFAGLYLGVLSLVMACYRMAQVPAYIFPLLILSKRLHSIFLLRLFNDCFAVGALFLAVYAYQRRIWIVGSMTYSWAVGTKMSVLLAAPAVFSILLLSLPLRRVLNAVVLVVLMVHVQLIIALPFLRVNAYGYIGRAFEFTRQFLFEWTVNWRFVGAEAFLSRGFSLFLAITNLSLLLLFFATRWIRPSGLALPAFLLTIFQPLSSQKQKDTSLRVTPSFVLTTMLSSLSIGMLCARSLHYQFFAYIAWSTPYLLWRSRMNPLAIYAIWAVQEWAWNVYPSTKISSMVVVGCLSVQVSGIWWGTGKDFAGMKNAVGQEIKKHEHTD
ncbi:dolichyl-P-Man:Man(5)GlcNAc(2)-PP-dolichol alpha-1,3-mannosyltransferase [Pseudocyphellaria aurata]|nr:dolichyl-P-Man:Man(5)GlcNAc(2)-PP-dolichol alpha-1,3-mannosyltransferase [Pseudocyphellaria aurata]